MSRYASKFAGKIDEYMAFRQSLGFSDHHAKILKRFDTYCVQFQPNAAELTKDIVCGWFDYELRISDRNLPARCAAIRSFAKFVGKESYMLPVDCVPKKKAFMWKICVPGWMTCGMAWISCSGDLQTFHKRRKKPLLSGNRHGRIWVEGYDIFPWKEA